MTTPFDIAEKNAQQFMAGLHTMQEIVKSLEDHKHAKEMIEECSRHKDLAPSIASFQAEIDEIIGLAKNLSQQLRYDHDRTERIVDEMTLSDYEGLLYTFDREFGSFVTLWR